MKLPKVQKETCLHIKREIEYAESENVFAVNMVNRLEKENPNIAFVIAQIANTSRDPKAVAICATTVYRLLETEKAMEGERPMGLVN